MIIEEQAMNHELPKELSEVKIFVCTKTEQIGKEEVTTAWDPTTDETVDVNDQSNLMTFEAAHDLKEMPLNTQMQESALS